MKILKRWSRDLVREADDTPEKEIARKQQEIEEGNSVLRAAIETKAKRKKSCLLWLGTFSTDGPLLRFNFSAGYQITVQVRRRWSRLNGVGLDWKNFSRTPTCENPACIAPAHQREKGRPRPRVEAEEKETPAIAWSVRKIGRYGTRPGER
jgi:hypothetical protein